MKAGYSKSEVYCANYGIVKQYTEVHFRLVHMRSCRLPGFRKIKEKKIQRGQAGNEEKLIQSLSRSRKMVFEYAECNEWDYFVTLTLDGDKRDRYDLKRVYTEFSKWTRNQNRNDNSNIKYLIIPEPHKDGAWHFHGLIKGIPERQLELFSMTDNIPLRIKTLLAEGHSIFNWIPYANKFGWVTAEKIRNKEAVSRYITKYITKELLQSRIDFNHHVYYCSQGLKHAEVVHTGIIENPFLVSDYENEYVRVKDFNNIMEPLEHFLVKEAP